MGQAKSRPHPTAGPAAPLLPAQLPALDQKFCRPCTTTLVLTRDSSIVGRPHAFTIRNDDGVVWFKCVNSSRRLFARSTKLTLLDPHNCPVLTIKAKFPTPASSRTAPEQSLGKFELARGELGAPFVPFAQFYEHAMSVQGSVSALGGSAPVVDLTLDASEGGGFANKKAATVYAGLPSAQTWSKQSYMSTSPPLATIARHIDKKRRRAVPKHQYCLTVCTGIDVALMLAIALIFDIVRTRRRKSTATANAPPKRRKQRR
ncbi:hypothetical protein RI367_002016 [Sorochytrium milnesiophthora]